MYGVKRRKGALSEDVIDEESSGKDTKRKSRNLSEKKRRDQFNLLVNELCTMVSSGGRKMDKSTVLKSSISFLKNQNELAARSRNHGIQEDWKPSFLTNEKFSHLLLEAVHGFIIIFSALGKIFYASESIMSLLGYLPNELLSTSFYEMILDEEQKSLHNSLVSLADRDSGHLSFSCHIKCTGANDQKYLELVNFTGYFKNITEGRGNKHKYSTETLDNRVFIGTGTLQTPQLIRDIFILDDKSEFTSRHSLEWKFLFLDHRAPPIIGYLPFELLGTSGYDYYHIDDLDNVVNCHEAVMQKSEGTSCYYRFLTKGQQWIWLQTHFFITYHQWNSKPEFVVCSHRVVSYWDVLKQNKFDTPASPIRESNDRSWLRRTSLRSAESLRSVDTQRFEHSKLSKDSCYTKVPRHIASLPTQAVAPTNFLSEITSEQILLHADLQKKHAELQASIGQQQTELMVVSEQLLMARLGFISAQTQQAHIPIHKRPIEQQWTSTEVPGLKSLDQTEKSVAAAFASNTPGVVSSTTMLPTVQNDLLTPPMAQSSANLFHTLDSNTLINLTEL